ncbi:MAG: SUMF1/EgtB/PvdO family nonheme iron enzyme [Zavarzinella sp.]
MHAFFNFFLIAAITCTVGPLLSNEPTINPLRLAQLIKQLDDDDFDIRTAATAELSKLGMEALPALRLAERSDSAEVRVRAKKIIALIEKRLDSRFVVVAHGKFQMGTPPGAPDRQQDEGLHEVELTKHILVGKYEVTQEEFEKVMGYNPSHFIQDQKIAKKLPVEKVSWFDALEYCNKLCAAEKLAPYYELKNIQRDGKQIIAAEIKVLGGNGYRLPTEAEWEFFCRAGTTTPYFFGNGNTGTESNVKSKQVAGAYGISSGWNSPNKTVQVGHYLPNDFGIHEVHGNVAEWVFDWYDKNYYNTSPKIDPTGPPDGKAKCVRGGSWMMDQALARSSARYSLTPDERKHFVGFRVVRNFMEQPKK